MGLFPACRCGLWLAAFWIWKTERGLVVVVVRTSHGSDLSAQAEIPSARRLPKNFSTSVELLRLPCHAACPNPIVVQRRSQFSERQDTQNQQNAYINQTRDCFVRLLTARAWSTDDQ